MSQILPSETGSYVPNHLMTDRPETQAALVRELMDWLDRATETPPDDSTVRKKVSRLWRAGIGG